MLLIILSEHRSDDVNYSEARSLRNIKERHIVVLFQDEGAIAMP